MFNFFELDSYKALYAALKVSGYYKFSVAFVGLILVSMFIIIAVSSDSVFLKLFLLLAAVLFGYFLVMSVIALF